jgi:DNA-binding response OmpR family regulator
MKNTSTATEQYSILIIDDERHAVEYLAAVLGRERYKIFRATNGEEGLKILDHERVDLVLLDISMPVMDGFETLARIRVHKKTKETPVIFLTGYMRDTAHMERGFNLGVNEYLVKPIDSGELLVRVRSMLRMTSAEKKVKQLQSDFFSMLVHDLRGPLSAINSFAELMKDEKVNEESREDILRLITQACNYMLDIITDILDLSKLESEYVTLTKE